MTAQSGLRTVGTWSGQDIDAQTVQGQLTRLWRSASEHAGHSGEPAGARTNVLTLVVHAGSEATEERALNTVGTLVEHHPSRTILVRAEPSAGAPALAADVITRCRLDRPQVCFEQIVLHAHGSSVEQVASAVASLLLRDLATYLWWPDDVPQRLDLLRRLVTLCDGVIVDSACFAEPVESLPSLLSLLQEPMSAGVVDLQWARLNGWRDSTAQFFDSPATRAYLSGLTSVEVDVRAGDQRGLPAAGLLYVAWLAGRLGWRAPAAPITAAGGVSEFTLTAGNRPVAIRLRSVPHDATEGDQMCALGLRAAIGDKTAEFAIRCAEKDEVTARVAEAGAPAIERTMRLPAPTDAMVLAQLLGYFRRDPIYEQSLRVLQGWLRPGAEA